MANFFGNLSSGQAMGLGTQMIQDVMHQQQEKQQFAFEKQKFDLLSSIQKAEEKRNKILFSQQQNEIKNKEKAFAQMGKLLEGLFDDEGNTDPVVAKKLMALQASITGTVNNNLLKLFQTEESTTNWQSKGPGIIFDPKSGQTKDVPKTPNQIAEEQKAREEEQKKIEEKAKKDYDRKVKERIDLITKLTDKDKLKSLSARDLEDQAKQQLADEVFRNKRGYLPVRSEWQEPGYFGRLGNILGIGPHFKLGGRLDIKRGAPNMFSQPTEKQQFIDHLVNDKKIPRNEAIQLANEVFPNQ